jgi:hypothetical protein
MYIIDKIIGSSASQAGIDLRSYPILTNYLRLRKSENLRHARWSYARWKLKPAPCDGRGN